MRILILLLLIAFKLPAQNNLSYYVALNAREADPDSSDFNKLKFLDTLLQGKRIVMLGESSHGTEEFSQTKFQLIQYLHEKLGFNIILFESPMIAGSYVNLAPANSPPDELVRNSIQTVWHTKTVSRLFKYLKEKSLPFQGIDPQFIRSDYPSKFFAAIFKSEPVIATQLVELENRISATFINGKAPPGLADSLAATYTEMAKQLATLELSPEQQWARQMMIINSRYFPRINKGDERDSCMAKNLIWLAEKMYPGEKIIVWAHNSHIDKNSNSSVRFMGKLAAEHFGDQLYAIGFYMLNGETALNNRQVISVKPPPRNSLEELLSRSGFKAAFISTDYAGFNHPMFTLHWGRDRQKLNLHKSYDAVILCKDVSPPVYLE